MKRSCAVKLTLVTSVAALLVQCDRRPTRYCVDENQNVIDDSKCAGTYTSGSYGSYGYSSNRYRWYYGGAQGFVPNGTHLTGGSIIAPRGGFVTRSFSSPGGGSVRGIIGHAGSAASSHGGGS
jgi:hypothetical protein